MQWLKGLVPLAYLRRIAKATERQAASLESIAQIEVARWARETVKPKPRQYAPSTFSLDEAEKEYTRRKEEGTAL
jgi:hypothetical protein